MKISIIIPAYNIGQYIEKCINSILLSKLDGMEIIVVDDGSNDSTPDILDHYASENKIIAVHQQNAGASAARNAGLEIAHGEYIGFVDSDDWVESNMFSKLYWEAKRNDADIVFCNIYKNDSEKQCKYLESGCYDEEQIKSVIYPLLISNINERSGKTTMRGSAWCKLFRSELLKAYNIRYKEDLVYNEDGLFCIEATVRAKRYLYLGDDYLYHNRITLGSVTKRYIPNLWNRQKVIINYLRETVKCIEYDFSDQISKKLFLTAVYCVENEHKKGNPNSEQKRYEIIKRIAADNDLLKELRKVEWKRLSNINRAYYWGFKLASPKLLIAVAEHRERKHNTQEK